MNHILDPRVHAFRADIADISLRGQVESARFVTGTVARVMIPIANLHSAPDINSPNLSQALLGEGLKIFETHSGWHWVQMDADGYVGYIAEHACDYGMTAPKHMITVPLAHVYPQPDIKLHPLEILPMAARIVATETDNGWLSLARGGYVKSAATLPVTTHDIVAVAETLLGAPYLWGGRTAMGIDCSGLVQLAMQMTGQSCPRDSDQQADALGQPVADNATLQRGDLVFFKGHVGIMHDAHHLLHANAHTMNVAIEPLAKVQTRAAVTAVRRL